MTQGGYPPGMGQADHDHYFGDAEPEVDEDVDYDEYRDSPGQPRPAGVRHQAVRLRVPHHQGTRDRR